MESVNVTESLNTCMRKRKGAGREGGRENEREKLLLTKRYKHTNRRFVVFCLDLCVQKSDTEVALWLMTLNL